ncbi:MAG: MFS transporter [Dehalococcoidia bacterium]|jgi:EmrB/QacA subfamily drug resistance transporter|nr:MFS transporter [Dehalococcoidia bacterium]
MSRYLIFVTVSLALLLSGVGGTSVAVALEAIREYFDVSVVLAGWIIGVFQLALVISMPLSGKVCDVLGRKPTFMLCVGLFVLGSLGSALAPNMPLLIVSRLVQAMGAGGFMPTAVGIVADVFPRSRQRAIGLFSSIFPIGQIAGPVVGGWLVESLGWRSVFWLNVPLGLAILIPAALLLHTSPGQRKGGIDIVGAALVSGLLASLMGGLTLIGYAATAQMWLVVGALFALTGILVVLFKRHEATARDPIIDVEILRERPFLAANIFNLIYGAGVLGVMSLIPMFAISVYGVSYLESGLILTPRAVGMFVTSLIVSIFMMRWGYRRPILAGTGLTMVSLVLLSLEPQRLNMLGQGLDSITVLSLIMLLMGMGVGLSAPASNNACIELMPERAATITGIRGMFRQAGGAASVTLATLVLHQSGDIASGFRIVFVSLAVALVATVPAIFAMPRSPTCPAPSESTGSK